MDVLSLAGYALLLCLGAGTGNEPLETDVQLAGRLVDVDGRIERYGALEVVRVTSLEPSRE